MPHDGFRIAQTVAAMAAAVTCSEVAELYSIRRRDCSISSCDPYLRKPHRHRRRACELAKASPQRKTSVLSRELAHTSAYQYAKLSPAVVVPMSSTPSSSMPDVISVIAYAYASGPVSAGC